ncbi:unnamed protein product [Orchesella dallaii]|uniref:Protein kinase domain-containing protein n=1 Tax=Orchesella dallaii TaxID=48710 RepID=A0ABP1RHZ5_9HEXA
MPTHFIIIFILASKIHAITVSYDWTEPINEIISGNKSLNAVLKALDLPANDKKYSEKFDMAMVYDTDCPIFGDCENQTEQAVNLLSEILETMPNNISLIVALSFRLEIPRLAAIDLWEFQTKLILPNQNFAILFTIPETKSCNDLKNIPNKNWEKLFNKTTWISYASQDKFLSVGIGYSESLIGCTELNQAMKRMDFGVTLMNFGNTVGVTESFDLFVQRLNFLHKQNRAFVEFSRIASSTEPEYHYYPTPQSIGDKNYRRLLFQYGRRLSSGNVERVGIVVPPNPKSLDDPIHNRTIIIPYGGTGEEPRNADDDVKWCTQSALCALSKYFNLVVFTPGEWKLLKSKPIESLSVSVNKTDNCIRFDVILDYSDNTILQRQELADIRHNQTSAVKFRFEFKQFDGMDYSPLMENVTLKSVIFGITLISGSYSASVASSFTNRKQIPSDIDIGCALKLDPLDMFIDRTIRAVVMACKVINGSFYVIRSQLNIKPGKYMSSGTYLKYENVVRKELERLKKLGSLIIRFHADAAVYLQLFLNTDANIKNDQGIFCNLEIYAVNEYIEAIANWARIHNVTIIFGRAFGGLKSNSPFSWLSSLRPSISPEYDNMAKHNTFFVLRNFPEGINNWEVDPCVNKENGITAVNYKFFLNTFVGTIFETWGILNGKRVIRNEYEMMLQLILSRFYVVEIVVRNNWQEVIMALGMQQAYTHGVGNWALLHFTSKETEADRKILEFKSFLILVKREMFVGSIIIDGIHLLFDVSEDIEKTFVNRGKKLDAEILKTEAFMYQVKEFNFRFGIFLEMPGCVYIAHHISLGNSTNSRLFEFLRKIDYIICEETFSMQENYYSHDIAEHFDTHLFLKKIFQRFQPNLEIAFRVNINVDFANKVSSRYVLLISYYKLFGSAYDINYLLIQAFDFESTAKRGWWEINNYSDLASPLAYKENHAEYAVSNMFRPYPLVPGIARKKLNGVTKNGENTNRVPYLAGLVVVALGTSGRNSKPNTNKYELSLEEFSFDTQKILGFGNFGIVYEGAAKGHSAAIKKPNDNCPLIVSNVLSEIKVLSMIGEHQNVVRFIGACTEDIEQGILYVATELCSGGSVLSFLRRKQNFSFE